VIKADAYGHGAARCAQALLPEADGFAVAFLEEAIALREAGIGAPILLLEGFFEESELELIGRHHLWTAVAADWQIDAIARAALPQPLKVWLKLDSGMHRLGFAPGDYHAAWQRLHALPQVEEVVLMSHFARADELDSARTGEQLAVQAQAYAGLPSKLSISNSPALLAWPQAHSDWARPGLMLYGASPFGTAAQAQAAAAAGDDAGIARVRRARTGHRRTGRLRRPVRHRASTRVGVVALGYADGYPQFAPNGTPVVVDGQPAGTIGRVSMDMLTVDLTDLPEAGIGSRVELWGKQVPVTDVAAQCQSSAYTLLCGLKRVPREYV
jgi:alanine racemase